MPSDIAMKKKKKSKTTSTSESVSTTPKKGKKTETVTPSTVEPADIGPKFAPFSHALAFSRTLGLVTVREQRRLAKTRVAIAGMGGVGGAHSLALVRAGFGCFNVADFDIFEVGNFNRQVGAMMSTVGQEKVEVMANMVRDINPEADIRLFRQGINEDNIDDFLKDVDIVVDGIDFFAPRARRLLMSAAHRLGKPVVCAGPIGMGTCVMVYQPSGMTFDEYTGITDASDDVEMCVRFLVALLPKVLHGDSNMEPWRLDLAAKTAPSHAAGINMAAGVLTTEAVKLALGRGSPVVVPNVWQVDAFSNQAVVTKGNRPGQAWFRNFRGNFVLKQIRKTLPVSLALSVPDVDDDLTHILEAGRWAPSLRNRQGWSFTRISAVSVRVALSLPTDTVAKERGAAAVLQEFGGLLEVMRIAAAERLRRPWYTVVPLEEGATELVATVMFRPASRTTGGPDGFLTLPEAHEDDELVKAIRRRHTNRGPFLKDELYADVVEEAQEAAAQLGAELTVHSSSDAIAAMAKANAAAAKLQRSLDGGSQDAGLVHDEMFPVHGMSRKGQGSSGAAKKCGAYATLSLAKDAAWSTDTVVRGGAALVRVWLVFTRHWVEVHPYLAAVAYSWAHTDGSAVAKESAASSALPTISGALARAWGTPGPDAARALITMRLGRVKKDPATRALRRDLDELMATQTE